MTSLEALPKELRALVAPHDIIVFDGDCVLCTRFFQFMLGQDHAQHFRYATAQSALGQKLYAALGMPLDDFESNLVITGRTIHTHMDAFAAAMSALGWPWRALAICRFLPGPIKRPLYRLVARNRFRLFGRRDSCYLPTPDIRARFLDAP
ncbi:DUF393 domain-containing protein [Oceanicola sp. D3]|uniref:thiol-disulfide oxidoreductase DCC family protein n=1 Tax=Oceanicola sp. D3 TaxID=2587163 RepID=UPI00111F6A13|nr:DCC1-like thiol-disulfide oxidoreductase family protein [Oceanicola sp. D3]QDC10479.1 DUF393 domain-containing protein [Oceanicola sp. D3]